MGSVDYQLIMDHDMIGCTELNGIGERMTKHALAL